MGGQGIFDRAQGRYSLKDVQEHRVEVVSVIARDELDQLVAHEIQQQAAALVAELERARQRIAALEADAAGGLERAAAEAALEAEKTALEAKAAAELRAEQAEAKVAELTRRVEELEAGGARAPAPAAAAAAAPAATAAAAAPEASDAVTQEEIDRAHRLAAALLDDVFSDDEDKAKAAIQAGTFRDQFAEELEGAAATFKARTRAEVIAEADPWEAALSKLEAEHRG